MNATAGSREMPPNPAPRYDLIPRSALRRVAARYALGASKYGEDNYKLGLPYWGTYYHLFEHLLAYNAGDRSDDHLAAVIWGCMTLMYFEEQEAPQCISSTISTSIPTVKATTGSGSVSSSGPNPTSRIR